MSFLNGVNKLSKIAMVGAAVAAAYYVGPAFVYCTRPEIACPPLSMITSIIAPNIYTCDPLDMCKQHIYPLVSDLVMPAVVGGTAFVVGEVANLFFAPKKTKPVAAPKTPVPSPVVIALPVQQQPAPVVLDDRRDTPSPKDSDESVPQPVTNPQRSTKEHINDWFDKVTKELLR